MKAEKFKETLIYIFLLCVLSFMLLSCNKPMLSKRYKTEDEKQMEFFKEQIKIKQYYITKI